MADVIAKKQVNEWSLAYLVDLWEANRLQYDDVPKTEQFSNREIAECKHVQKIFGNGRTRILDKDPEFFQKVCKRSFDATTKHPVIVMGNWRQGKSSFVNAVLGKEDAAQTGRRKRTTIAVRLYEWNAGDELGTILLADTPGLEPDAEYNIAEMYRTALTSNGCSPGVLVDLIVLVVAGTPQGISSLSSQKIFSWIQREYHQFRASSSLSCTVLPVITHGDMIHETDRGSDKDAVCGKLRELSMSESKVRAVAYEPSTMIADPLIVCCPDASKGRKEEGIQAVRDKILEHIRISSNTHQFRMQWAKMLTCDLQASIQDFQSKHPDEETDRRLFHRTMEAMLATYQKKSMNLETALTNPSWHLLDIIERKLRNEECAKDRMFGYALSCIPCSPKEMSPFALLGGAAFCARKAYASKDKLIDVLIRGLQRIPR